MPIHCYPFCGVRPLSRAALVLMFASTCGLSFAQTDQSKTRDSEMITLPAFNVVSQDDGSYVSAETTTGTRINSKVKDLPFSVSMLTSEFFKDFSIFEAGEELSYMSAVTGVDAGGNVNLRGFNGGAPNLRNGLASSGLIDTSSIERIEVIKGPAAAIYGQTSPAGTLVVTTKKPSRKPTQSISITTGSYDTMRVVASAAGPLGLGSASPRLFYRIDSQYYHRLYEIEGMSQMIRSVTGTLIYRHSDATSITLDSSYYLNKSNSSGGIPFLWDSTTSRYAGGYAFELRDKIITSPYDVRARWNAIFGAAVEHRFSSVVSAKLATSITHRPLSNYLSYGGSQYSRTLNRIVNGRRNILYAKDDFDGRNAAFDLTAANYSLGSTKQRTLLTVDYSWQRRDGYNTTSTTAFNNANPGLSASAQKQVDSTFNIVPKQEVTASNGGPSFNPVGHVRDSYVAVLGYFLRQEATLLGDRLIATAGYRHDEVHANLSEPSVGTKRKVDDSNDSLLLGATWRVTNNLSWYVNRNESFTPIATNVSSNPTAEIPRTTVGIGYETGVKGEFFDGKLGFTASIYDTRRENEQVREVDVDTGVVYTAYIGNTKTQGAEIDLNWRLTKQLQAITSYSYVDAIAVNTGVDVDAEGRPTKGRPKHAASLALRYQAMPRLSFTLGMRYVGESPAFNPTENGGAANPVTKLITTHNGGRDVFVPSSTIWTAGMTYRWKSKRYVPVNHDVTLTGKNLTDRVYIVPGNNRILGDGLGVYLTYTLSH